MIIPLINYLIKVCLTQNLLAKYNKAIQFRVNILFVQHVESSLSNLNNINVIVKANILMGIIFLIVEDYQPKKTNSILASIMCTKLHRFKKQILMMSNLPLTKSQHDSLNK